MANNLHMDIDMPAIVLALRKQDAHLVARIQIRQALFSRRVETVIKEKKEYFHEVTDALADVEIRCDAVQTYVEEFLRDRSQRKKFERRLQKTIKLLEKTQATQNAPSTIKKTGPYTLYEMKLNFTKVQFKLESLQTLVKNAVEDKIINTTSVQPRKPKHNQAGASSPVSSLSPRLDRIIKQMLHTLSLSSTVMTSVESKQKKLADLAAQVKSADQKDFYLIAVNHAHVHDMLDALQRTVYDKTVSHLTASQVANLPIGRPVEKPNEVVPIKSCADLNKSAKNIQMRLEKINAFCNENLDNQLNDVMSLLWTQGIDEVELYLNEDIFPDIQDIPDDGAGDQPQADPSQADDLQGGPSEADETQGGPSQVDEPQRDPSQVDEPQGDPSQADKPRGGLSQAGEPPPDEPQAGPSQAGETEGSL